MKKITVLSVALAMMLVSCNQAKQGAQDATNSAIEEAIEKNTGNQVDLPDAQSIEANAGYVSYQNDKTVYLDGKEKMQATVTIQKENEEIAMSIQFAGEGGKSFLATISHVPLNFKLPLVGKFAVSNAYDGEVPSATVLFLNVTENGMMSSAMPFEGTLTISKLSKDNIEFNIDAKGGDATDASSPSNWSTINGSGKAATPMVMSFGIDKNDVLK